MAADQFTVKGSLLFDTSFFDKGVKKATGSLKKFGAQATRVGRDVSTYLGIPIIAAATAALKTATAFEFAQKKISALRGGANISKLTKSARDLGATTIFTATEVSELQLSLAKLGKSNATIQAIQKTTLQFAQAMDMQLAPAGEFIVKTMNRFSKSLSEVGDEQEQASFVANLFATAAANTALTAEALAASLNYVGSEAAVFGLSLGETTAILGLLADRGFDASRGGTALRRILGQLAKDGFTAEQAIGQLFDETKGFSQELEQFGLRGAGPAASIGGLKDEFIELKRQIEESDGFLQGFATTLDTSMTASFKRISSAFNELSIAFTEDFIKPINNAADNVARFVRKLATMSSATKGTIAAVAAFVVIFGVLVTIAGVVAAAIAAIAGVVGATAAVVVLVVGALLSAVAANKLFAESADAATYSTDELRRKLVEANEGLEDLANSTYINESQLQTLAQFTLDLTKLNQQLENQKSKNYFGIMADEIKDLEDQIAKTKKGQDDYVKGLREWVTFSKENKGFLDELLGENTPGEAKLRSIIANDTGESPFKEDKNLSQFLAERLAILERIEVLKKQAKSNKKTGLFDIEGLTLAKEQLAEIEKILALLGYKFGKGTGKKKDKPEFLNDLISDFEATNEALITLAQKDGTFTGPLLEGADTGQKGFKQITQSIESIQSEGLKAAKALEILNKQQDELARKRAEDTARGKLMSDEFKLQEKSVAALIKYYSQLSPLSEGFAESQMKVGFLLDDLAQKSEDLVKKRSEQLAKESALLQEQTNEITAMAMAVGQAFSNIIGGALRSAVEGTKNFGQALAENLLGALDRVLRKVIALIIAYGILAVISGGTSVFAGAAASATSDGLGAFLANGFGLGSGVKSTEGNLRVEGVLSGSDVVLGSRRGATALDRIYG